LSIEKMQVYENIKAIKAIKIALQIGRVSCRVAREVLSGILFWQEG
jgi:hypothetical protein